MSYKRRKGDRKGKGRVPIGTRSSLGAPASAKPRRPEMPKRECGECTACCYVFGIGRYQDILVGGEPFQKDDWTECPHVCSDGCGVYRNRPPECRSFECGWLKGFGEDRHRPDRCGVVATTQHATHSQGVMPALVFYEIRDGASQEGDGLELIGTLSQSAARAGMVALVQSKDQPQRRVDLTIGGVAL